MTQLTLCNNCNCMTKTIGGVCGKCKEEKMITSKEIERLLQSHISNPGVVSHIVDLLSTLEIRVREKTIKQVLDILKYTPGRKECEQKIAELLQEAHETK